MHLSLNDDTRRSVVEYCRLLHESPDLQNTINSINTKKKSRYHTSSNQTTATTAEGLMKLKLQRSAAAVAVAVNQPRTTGIIMK